MFIYWGTKCQTKMVGYCAHYCIPCQDVTVHKYSNIQKVPHVYGIGIGMGEAVAAQLECQCCSSLTLLEPRVLRFGDEPELEPLLKKVPADRISIT